MAEPRGTPLATSTQDTLCMTVTKPSKILLRRAYLFDRSTLNRVQLFIQLWLINLSYTSRHYHLEFPTVSLYLNNASIYLMNDSPKTKLHSHTRGSHMLVYELILVASSDHLESFLTCYARRFFFKRWGDKVSGLWYSELSGWFWWALEKPRRYRALPWVSLQEPRAKMPRS